MEVMRRSENHPNTTPPNAANPNATAENPAVAIESWSRLGVSVTVTVLLAAFLIRGFVCFRTLDSYALDPDGYQAYAYVLATEGSFGSLTKEGTVRPSAFRPPFYPYMLSMLPGELSGQFPNVQVSPRAVAWFHTLLGCLTSLFTFLAARRMIGWHSLLPSILASALVIVDPILIQQSNLVMTETLATAIVSVILWWWVRRDDRTMTFQYAAVLGFLVALAYLCRPTFLVWGALLCVASLCAKPKASDSKPSTFAGRFAKASLVGLILFAAVAAWTLRNQKEIGHPIWATSHGGYTLLLGNNPPFYDYLRHGEWGTAWDADSFLTAYARRFDRDMSSPEFWGKDFDSMPATSKKQDITEHDDDQLSYNAAVATIRRQPKMFVYSCFVRVARLWTPLAHQTKGRHRAIIVAVGGYYIALYLMILVSIRKLGFELLQAKWWASLALIFTLTCVHAVYWSNMRMRAPAIPVIAIAAAAAFSRRQAGSPLKEDINVANQ